MNRIFRVASILAILFVLSPLQSFATHIMGGEITWRCLSDGRYVFQFSVYRDCSGANVPPRGPLVIFNYPNVGQSTIIANQAQYNANQTIDRDISPECRPGGATFSCAGGDDESVFEYIRESDPIRLLGTPPAQGWIITYDDVARNDNENLQGQPGMTLRAKIFPFSGSVADTCVDNSPTFREEATSLLCLGSAFTYNHNASDVELDSLVYNWARPLDDVNTNFPYNEGSNPSFVGYDPGYGSGLPGQPSPFPDQGEDPRNVAANLNSSTGEISLTSFTSGKYVSVVQVDAYKCGEKVAEIYRELQSNIAANCALNEDPILRPPFNSFTSYRDTVRAGDLVTFNLQITDFPGPNNPNSDSVFVTATGFQWGANFTNANAGCANPPCATLSRPLPDSGLFAAPNNTFTWQTDCNHVAFTDGCVSLENTYNFVIRATDDACPIPGQTIATISITVLADSVIESPLINCVDVLPNGDVNLDWNTTPDPNNSFTAWMIYSATNENGPYTIIDSVKTYNQTTYTHSGAGSDNQRRWYYIRSRSGCKGIVQNVARDTVSTLFVQPTLDQTCVGISWNSLSDPNNPAGSATTYRIFREYPIGTGMNFLQNAAVESFCDNFSACEDSVAYRIELINTVEACTSRSNVIGFRFDRKPQTNFTVPATTCSGPVNFTNLTTAVGGNINYIWDFGDGSPTSNQVNPSHTFSGSGPFTVSLTASTGPGCDSTFTQLVNLGPDVDAGADVSICSGGNVTLGGFPTTNAVNPTFNWSPATGLSSTTVSNPTATPTVTTTYTVVVTDQNSCTSSDQVVVTVNPLPFADAGTNQNICEGETATLGGVPTGPAGAVYQWDNAGTLNDATSANPIANPTVTTTYSVTVTSGVNCSATDQVTITVDPTPTANAGTDQSICPGSVATLGTAALPGLSYSWDNTASLNNGTIAQPTATPTVTTTYTVVVTDGNGCTNTDQITITVDPLPTADAGLDQNICTGQSIAIGGSPTAPFGATSVWDNAASLSSATIANPVASPTATTTYTVTVTDGNGCSATDQITITVNPLPTADAGADQTICEGESATLGGAPTGPAGATYAWDNAGSLDDATLANPTATPTVTTTYTVTVSDGAGCSATDQITITVNPTPNVDAGADRTICDGGSVLIGGSPTSSTAGANYSWDNVSTLDNATLANPTASPTSTTTYTVVVTHPNGCTSSDQVTVNVDVIPLADAGLDQTICEGEAVILGTAAVAGNSYNWNNAASLNSSVLAQPLGTPSVTTTYTVTVTNAAGCTNTDDVTITVNPSPNVDAGADQAICAGESITLGGSPTSTTLGATYAWDNAGSLDDATLANPTATPTVTTTYTVVVTDGNGCSNTDQVTITVDPLPTVDAGADQAICIDGSATLGGSPTGPAGSTYAWDNAASLDDATLANPTATPTVTTTYTVTVTDGNGCSATNQITITVNPLPTADAGADQTICAGESATLGGAPTGPAGATYTWDNAASLDDATLANPTATPTVTTTYTVTVTDGAGCSATDQVTITVNPLPNVDAGPDQSICSGGSVSLGGSPTSSTAGVTYAWDNAASLDDATIANPTATPTVSTTYTVTVNDANGCTATDQITITVGSLPDVDAGADQSICSGESATLGGSPTSTTAGVSYTWDNAASLDDATLANPTATPTVTTTYTVTVSDGAGCIDTDQITITVDPLPTADAGADQAICAGESITIGGSPTSTTVGATYAWDNAASLDDATLANPTATPTVTTTYTVTVSHPNGCTIIDQITITVDPLPTVDAGADQAICIGGSATLGGAPTGPAGSTYAWDNAASLDDATTANPTATPTVSTTYTVTVTDGNGCSATDQITITVNPLPTADAGADQTICEGESATLGGAPTGPAGATYTWDNAASLDDATLANPTATPTVTTTYTITVTDGNGCSATDQITITVDPLPTVDAGADQAICVGGSVSLGGSPTSSTAGVTYAWDNAASLDDATIANPTATPSVTTTYTVTVTHPNGCTATDQIIITVNSLPSANAGADATICSGSTIVLGGSPTGPPASSYSWDNPASLDDATLANPTANPTATTTYTVTVTDVNGCTNTDQVTITVEPLPNVDAGPDRTICDLQSTPIGGAPTSTTVGATFAWDNAASLNDPALANPVASPRTTTTYTLTVTHPNGCTDTDQVVVNVNPLPTVDAGADQAICIGSSTNLGGSPSGPAGSSFAWDNAASLNDATIANPIASPTATTTYTLTVTDVNGCVNTDQVTITVNPLPIADAGLDRTICEADTILLGTTANPAYSYSWDNAATLDDNSLAQPRAFPSATTTYTVTVTETATSCTSTDQVVINVLPQPFANAGSDDTLCLGESVILGGSPTGPAGATFAWDNAASLSDPAVSNPTAAPQTTTTYIVTVTDAVNGCTNTAQVTIVVNPLPTVDAGADQDICLGDSITLGGSPTGPIGAIYSWDNTISLDDAGIANPLAFPTDTTTYTVLVTDTNGCVSTDQIVINVVPSPSIDAGFDQTICLGDSISLGGSPAGPVGANYNWRPSNGLSDNSVPNPLASPSDTTIYILTITASTGCISTDTVIVNVNAVPEANFGVDQRCISDLAAFSDSSTISIGSIVAWNWEFGDGTGVSSQQNPAYQYATAGVYDVKLKVTSLDGCVDSVVKTVTINDLPLAVAGPDTSLCIGDTIQIGDQASFNPNVTYAWSPATEITDVNAASPMVFPLSTTNYFLSVTDQNGCVNFDTVEVSVNPLPIIQATADTSVCSFSDLQLNATGGDTYLWSPADYLDNPTLANPIARAEKSIQYVVLGTDLNGCESTDTVNVEVFNVDFQSYNTSVCARDSIQLMPVLEGDTVGITYNWSPDLGLSSSILDSPMVAPPFSQEYKLRVRNAIGCTNVDSILVDVKTNANVRFDYVNSARCSGSVLEIENNSTNADRFLWKVNGLARTDEYNPKIGINNADTNIITLIGWNQNCSDSLQVVVEPATFEEILQYKGTNVFTPNGDGINDIFDPGFEGEFIGCADFRVYDRWGEKVFDSNIGQYGWDGRTLRGRVAPAGVYYYVIIVAGREVKGSVLLGR